MDNNSDCIVLLDGYDEEYKEEYYKILQKIKNKNLETLLIFSRLKKLGYITLKKGEKLKNDQIKAKKILDYMYECKKENEDFLKYLNTNEYLNKEGRLKDGLKLKTIEQEYYNQKQSIA